MKPSPAAKLYRITHAGKVIAGLLLMIVMQAPAQQACAFVKDSCVLPPGNSKLQVEMLDAGIKNNYHVQLIRAGRKQFLKLIVTDNLSFGKTGPLLLKSGSKQMYFKSATLNVIDGHSACFVLELYPNYLVTLKDDGFTDLVFNNNMEFTVPKPDSESIKLLAKCFYSLTTGN